MKYLRFEDADDLISHLHLMDASAITVAIRDSDGNNTILFNNDEGLETLLCEVSEAANKLPIDAEIIGEDEYV